MPAKRDKLSQADATLHRMAREGKSQQALQAQRTKVENLTTEYWVDVWKAVRRVNAGESLADAVEAEDVDPEDAARALTYESGEPIYITDIIDGPREDEESEA